MDETQTDITWIKHRRRLSPSTMLCSLRFHYRNDDQWDKISRLEGLDDLDIERLYNQLAHIKGLREATVGRHPKLTPMGPRPLELAL